MLRHRKIGVLVALFLSIWTAVAAAAPFAYVTNSGNNSVLVIDAATGGANTITLPLAAVPWGVALSSDSTRVYVTNFVPSGSLFVIDASTNTLVTSPIPVGFLPVGVAVHPSGTRAYVTRGVGGLAVVNLATSTVTQISNGSFRGVVITPNGAKAYAANYFGGSVVVFDTMTHGLVTTIPVGDSPMGLAASQDGSRIYVANEGSNNVSIVDTATDTVVGTVFVGEKPFGITVTPDGRRAYVTNSFAGTVSVFDTATGAPIVGDIPVGRAPMGISTNGSKVYVAVRDDNKVAVIDVLSNAVVGSVPANRPIAFGQFVPMATRVDTMLALRVEPVEVIVGASSPVQLRATLTRKDSSPVSGGSIAFSMDSLALGSVLTDARGDATWSVNPSSLAVGAHQVRVAFAESVITGTTLAASSASGSFRVVYQWGGWMPPVAGGGTLNPANAGSTIPMKWRLRDANGNDIAALNAITEIQTALIACAGDGIMEVSAAAGTSGNGVHIDGASQQFQFNWKTDKSWAGQCRAFIVRLADGTTRMAKFHFR